MALLSLEFLVLGLSNVLSYDVFVLRCRCDPASDAPSLSLVEVKLNLAQPNQSIVIPLSLAMARALPQCGVLTTAGYLSLRSRDNVPNVGNVWDPEAQQAVTVAKYARAVSRARFNDVPQFPPPRPQSPDARSRHSGDSYETSDPSRRIGLADHPVHARFSPERVPAPRDRSHSPGCHRHPRSRDQWVGDHGNEVVLNATQVAESAALTQVRGVFEVKLWLAFSDNGALSARLIPISFHFLRTFSNLKNLLRARSTPLKSTLRPTAASMMPCWPAWPPTLMRAVSHPSSVRPSSDSVPPALC